MVAAPADVTMSQTSVLQQSSGPHQGVGVYRTGAFRGAFLARASANKAPDRTEAMGSMAQAQQQLVQRQRRRLQPHKEKWPWRPSAPAPREDARVPAPHGPHKTLVTDDELQRLSELTAELVRQNQDLQRQLAALRAQTYYAALVSSLRRPAAAADLSSPPSPPASPPASPGPWSPPPRPPSSLPSSPAPSSSWSSPPCSPGGGSDSDNGSSSCWAPFSP